MANRVVSTKLNEEEHKKILKICDDKGITVSKLLKKTLLESINEEKQNVRTSFNSRQSEFLEKKKQDGMRNDELEKRFMYY